MNSRLRLSFKIKLALFTTLATLLTIGFFILQGGLISSAIEGAAFTFYQFATAIILVKFCQIIILAFIEYLSESEKIAFRSRLGEHLFPETLRRHQLSLAPEVTLGIEQTIPSLFTALLKLYRIRLDFAVNLVFFLISFYFNPFPIGAVVIVPMLLLVFLREFITSHKLKNLLEISKLTEESFHRGVHEYFDSYNELKFNWKGHLHRVLSKIFDQTTELRNKIIATVLKRDLISGFLIELPYTLLILVVLFGLLRHQLPLTQIFVWFGLAQILIPSIQNLKQLREFEIQKDIQLTFLNKLKSKLRSQPTITKSTAKEVSATFRLQDNTSVFVSSRPGLYQIRGNNGSGKTTLVDTLIGQNDEYHTWPAELITRFRSCFSSDSIRIISRTAVVLSPFDKFRDQVCPSTISQPFEKKLLEILPNDLSAMWTEKFLRLEQLFSERPELELSQGESVLLSLFRCFSKWDSNVRLIVIDECDSNLDYLTRQLFYKTVHWMAKSKAVYWISHLDSLCLEEPISAFRFPITLLAIGDLSNSVRHCNLIAEIMPDGRNQTVAMGPVASALANELDRVKKVSAFHGLGVDGNFGFSIHLVDGETGLTISDSQSASLTAALLLKRLQLLSQNQIDESPIVATGMVTADGSVVATRGEDMKVKSWQSEFIYPIETSKDWRSLKEVFGLRA